MGIRTRGGSPPGAVLGVSAVGTHPLDDGGANLLQRILLITDGTVTNILEAYAGEPMQVVKLHQSIEPAMSEPPELEVADHEDVISREILLQGRHTGTAFIYAVSRIVPGRLSAALRQGLLASTKPIGLLLEESRAETFREILSSCREPAGVLGRHFGIEPDAELISRTYRVLAGGRPIMLITEKFPTQSFSLELERAPSASRAVPSPRHDRGIAGGESAVTPPGTTVWLTGLPGAGKSTIAVAVAEELRRRGRRVEVLDGDALRATLCSGLGFSKEDRDTNVRRIGQIAEMLTRNGVVVVVAAIAPYRAVRNEVGRRIAREGRFLEVHVHCPVAELIRRDRTGIYRRALAGEITNFTGVSDPYEEPTSPSIRVNTDVESVEQSVSKVIEAVLAAP